MQWKKRFSATTVKVSDTLPGNVEVQIPVLGRPPGSPEVQTADNNNCSANLSNMSCRAMGPQ